LVNTDPEPIEVLLLSEEDCEFCVQARGVLERLAGEYPLSIKDEPLRSERGQALALEGGVLFAPGVFLDGAAFSYGRLSERKLRRELERRHA
jgi:glutaredoxin